MSHQSIPAIWEQYTLNAQLFMHSDNYLQQRTTQFLTANSLLFAGFSVLVTVPPGGPGLLSFADILALLISLLGVFLSASWYSFFLRSAQYRRYHLNRLHSLEARLRDCRTFLDRSAASVDGMAIELPHVATPCRVTGLARRRVMIGEDRIALFVIAL